MNINHIHTKQKTVLITGGCGGLGSATANYLVEKGWYVFLSDIKKALLTKWSENNNVTALFMDVSDQTSINAAVQVVKESANRLDGLVNFAGVFVTAPMIEVSEELLYKVLNVNLLGTYRVNKAFFPLIQKHKGRIINISSETGWQRAGPFNGPYAISKHGIEAYSDALRRELKLLDIDVIKIQPGPFRSEITNNLESSFANAQKASIYFKNALSLLTGLVKGEVQKAHDPIIVARAVYKALRDNNPKLVYSVKPDKLRIFMRWLPVLIEDYLYFKILQR
jgi:NAD(P)-dependent dehydrogenase (short-subunit alcohol dehydrogenase family)